MTDPTLPELEQDVESARAKLARDIAILRSPRTYGEFTDAIKQEASETKDALLEKAKTKTQSIVEDFVENLKAKAAANPTAALAIGAGIAWRLVQRPPIATALVGAGLLSLLRTPATRRPGFSTEDYLAEAGGNLREQAGDLATQVKEQVGEAMETVGSRVSDIAQTAKESAVEWGGQAASSVTEALGAAKEKAGEIGKQASAAAQEVRHQAASRISDVTHSTESVLGDSGTRDTLLLAVASTAVIAALGISCQKRLSDEK